MDQNKKATREINLDDVFSQLMNLRSGWKGISADKTEDARQLKLR